MNFVLIRESKVSNLIDHYDHYFLLNKSILNISCRLSIIKHDFLGLEPKMPYLGTFRLPCEEKLLLHLKQSRIFQKAKFRPKLKVLNFGMKITLPAYFEKQF